MNPSSEFRECFPEKEDSIDPEDRFAKLKEDILKEIDLLCSIISKEPIAWKSLLNISQNEDVNVLDSDIDSPVNIDLESVVMSSDSETCSESDLQLMN